MAVGDHDCTNVDPLSISFNEACANPAVVCAVAIQVTKDLLTAQQPLHKGLCCSSVPVRKLRRIYSIQADRGSSYHNSVSIADIGSPGYLSGVDGRRAEAKEYREDR